MHVCVRFYGFFDDFMRSFSSRGKSIIFKFYMSLLHREFEHDFLGVFTLLPSIESNKMECKLAEPSR